MAKLGLEQFTFCNFLKMTDDNKMLILQANADMEKVILKIKKLDKSI